MTHQYWTDVGGVDKTAEHVGNNVLAVICSFSDNKRKHAWFNWSIFKQPDMEAVARGGVGEIDFRDAEDCMNTLKQSVEVLTEFYDNLYQGTD